MTICITDDMMVLEIDNCVVAIARLSEHAAADAGTARGSSRPNAPGPDVNDAANFMNALVDLSSVVAGDQSHWSPGIPVDVIDGHRYAVGGINR